MEAPPGGATVRRSACGKTLAEHKPKEGDSSGETCNYLPADITDSPCGDARLPVSEMAEAAKGDAGLRWQMLEDFVRQGGGSLVSMVPGTSFDRTTKTRKGQP